MNMVKNQYGREIDFDAAVNIMDDEVREQVVATDCDDDQDFFDVYCGYHLAKFGEIFEPNKENPVWQED